MAKLFLFLNPFSLRLINLYIAEKKSNLWDH